MNGPDEARAFFAALAERIEGRLFGVRDALGLVLVGILTDSHVLVDDVPGVGPTRKKALLKRFGSLARLRTATVEEIRGTPGVGPVLAMIVYDHLHRPDAPATTPSELVAAARRAG